MHPIFVWTITDAIGAVLAVSIGLAWFVVSATLVFHQWRCKHDGRVSETSACDAICRKCGKNLGFIGAWYAKQKAKE